MGKTIVRTALVMIALSCCSGCCFKDRDEQYAWWGKQYESGCCSYLPSPCIRFLTRPPKSSYEDPFIPPDNSGKVPQICGWCHGSGESQVVPNLKCSRCGGAGVTTSP